MNTDPFTAFILFFLVITSGFCTFISSVLAQIRTVRLEEEKQLFFEKEKPEGLIFSLELWNLLFWFCAGALVLYSFKSIYIAILFVFILIIFSKTLSSLIAAGNPEKMLPPLKVLTVLALPWKALYILSKLPAKKNTGEEEFLQALEDGEKTGAVESMERSMVEGVLYLGDRPVSAFMTHRSEIEWFDINATLDEVREKALAFRDQGFFPVIRGTQDNVVGVVPVQELLIALVNGASQWKGLGFIMKKPRFIPETLSALKAFNVFAIGLENENYLCVMDEYGGFAGHLRIRNLIDEIVGEPETIPGNNAEETLIRMHDGSYLADGSISLDELAEKPELSALGQEQGRDFHTLAGFILKLAGEIPKPGEQFNWEQYSFTIQDLDGNRINKVLIHINPQ